MSTQNKDFAEKRAQAQTVLDQLDQVVFGQKNLKQRTLTALFAGGHVLLEGVPGVAKTLFVRALTATIQDAKMTRLQMTADMKPSDIIGGLIFNPGKGVFEYYAGPIIGQNFVLVDEINRAPGKTQSALLEAMAEHKVTVDKQDYRLPKPFFVLATQNPIEQEGTYLLPEAQLDRFCFKLIVDYPEREAEKLMLQNLDFDPVSKIQSVITVQQLLEICEFTQKNIQADERILDYVIDIVRASRPGSFEFNGIAHKLKHEGKETVSYGGSPRAVKYLLQTAKARAFLSGREYVLPDDVYDVAVDVLRHRVIIPQVALIDHYTPEIFIEEVLKAVSIQHRT